jgi:hypothetical protein
MPASSTASASCLVELAGRRHDDLAGRRVDDVVERDAPDDAVAQPLDDFTAGVDNRPRFDAVERAAVVFRDDHVLRTSTRRRVR